MELHEESESKRANRLCEQMKNKKTMPIIFYNVWKYLDMVAVGIRYGDDHYGCKAFLTARDCNVLL